MLPRVPRPRSPSTFSVCSRASSPALFRARQVYAPESAAWSPSRSRELPSGDILHGEDRAVTYVSIPDVPMGQRCSVLGCNPGCAFWGALQGQHRSWDPAGVTMTMPGVSTVQDTRT